VREKEHFILWLLYGAVFVMCTLSFRNPLAALCVLLPLILVTELGHTLMVHLDIGMKINTLCVVALGVGIGVDYGIYLLRAHARGDAAGAHAERVVLHRPQDHRHRDLLHRADAGGGRGAVDLLGLKFQADMGILLTFMFILNMIAANHLPAGPCAAGSCARMKRTTGFRLHAR
jgi:predicted RND superfamily exporter protein